jgi:hypothetical protein
VTSGAEASGTGGRVAGRWGERGLLGDPPPALRARNRIHFAYEAGVAPLCGRPTTASSVSSDSKAASVSASFGDPIALGRVVASVFDPRSARRACERMA